MCDFMPVATVCLTLGSRFPAPVPEVGTRGRPSTTDRSGPAPAGRLWLQADLRGGGVGLEVGPMWLQSADLIIPPQRSLPSCNPRERRTNYVH